MVPFFSAPILCFLLSHKRATELSLATTESRLTRIYSVRYQIKFAEKYLMLAVSLNKIGEISSLVLLADDGAPGAGLMLNHMTQM